MKNQQPNNKDYWERNLLSACQSTNVKFVHIYSVDTFFGSANYLTLQLQNHCTTAFPGHPFPPSGSTLLQCPSIASQITQCQSLGVKVLLVLAATGTPAMKNDEDGSKVANMVWNSFLGGKGNRPFGDVVLDGVDIWIRDVIHGYPTMVKTLKSLMGSDSSRKYYIAGTPRCSFPDQTFGPTINHLPLTDSSSLFDYVTIDTTTTPQCNYLNKDLMYDALSKWSSWAATAKNNAQLPLFVLLPASLASGTVGAYIPAGEAKTALDTIKSKAPGIIGLSFWDFSTLDQSQPCTNDQRTYGEILVDMFKGKSLTCSPSTNNNDKPLIKKNSPVSGPSEDSSSASLNNHYFTAFIVAMCTMIFLHFSL
jgi:chitinase